MSMDITSLLSPSPKSLKLLDSLSQMPPSEIKSHLPSFQVLLNIKTDTLTSESTSLEREIALKIKALSTITALLKYESYISSADKVSALGNVPHTLLSLLLDFMLAYPFMENALSEVDFLVPLLKYGVGSPKACSLCLIAHLCNPSLFASLVSSLETIEKSPEKREFFQGLWKDTVVNEGSCNVLDVMDSFRRSVLLEKELSYHSLESIMESLPSFSILPLLSDLQTVKACLDVFNSTLDSEARGNAFVPLYEVLLQRPQTLATILLRYAELKPRCADLLLQSAFGKRVLVHVVPTYYAYRNFFGNPPEAVISKSLESVNSYEKLLQVILEYLDGAPIEGLLVSSLRTITIFLEDQSQLIFSHIISLRLAFRNLGCKLSLEAILCQLVVKLCAQELKKYTVLVAFPQHFINQMRFLEHPPVPALPLSDEYKISGPLIYMALDIYHHAVSTTYNNLRNSFAVNDTDFAVCLSSIFVGKFEEGAVLQDLGLFILRSIVVNNRRRPVKWLRALCKYLLDATAKNILLVDVAAEALLAVLFDSRLETVRADIKAGKDQTTIELLQELVITWKDEDRNKILGLIKIEPREGKTTTLDLIQLRRYLNLSEAEGSEMESLKRASETSKGYY